MLGGFEIMNYLPNFKDLINVANIFCNNYSYEIKQHSNGVESMGCAFINLENKNFPKLIFEMERYILDFKVMYGKETISLLSIYKYLHPTELLRNCISYRKKSNFRKYYISDQIKYFDDFMKNKDSFNVNDFHAFYEKYPLNVWKWIED